jgi:hypothetical protein
VFRGVFFFLNQFSVRFSIAVSFVRAVMGSSQSTAAPAPPAATASQPATGTAKAGEESLTQAAVRQSGRNPALMDEINKDGRYKLASSTTEKFFYESQPANAKGGPANTFRMPGSIVGAEGQRASEAARAIADEVARQGGKVTIIDNTTSREEMRRILSDTEGLNIGNKRRAELLQTWRFLLACDPVQYGLDAGFMLGCISAAGSLWWKHNRHPVRLACAWAGGFAVGMISFPVAMIAWEEYNLARISRNEKEMFAAQRADFRREQEATSIARDVITHGSAAIKG